jgi:hypothetical protein
MRRYLRASLAVLLLGCMVTTASAQKPASSTSWWPTWGQTPAKPAPEKTESKPKAKAPTMDRFEELARLESTYQRRLQVCDELRRVALETGDEKLEEEAMILEDLAWKLYDARNGRLLNQVGAGREESGKGDSSVNETRDMILKYAEKKRGIR